MLLGGGGEDITCIFNPRTHWGGRGGTLLKSPLRSKALKKLSVYKENMEKAVFLFF